MHPRQLLQATIGFVSMAIVMTAVRSRGTSIARPDIDQFEAASAWTTDRQRRPQPGDFVLVHGHSPVGLFVRWGQLLRFHGRDRQFAYWDHVALVVSTEGDIIEARYSGVVRRRLSQYKPAQYVDVPIDADAAARRRITDFAESMLGARYGFVSLLGVTVSVVTGREIVLVARNEETCTSLVVRALQHGGLFPGVEPSQVMPADLAKWCHVEIRPVERAGLRHVVDAQPFPPR